MLNSIRDKLTIIKLIQFFSFYTGRGKISVKDIQSKIQNVIQKLGVSVQALVSTGKGKYRKPYTGMWDFFLNEVRNTIYGLGLCFINLVFTIQ